MDFLWINILFEVEHMTRWQACVEDGRWSTNWSKNEALSRTTGWTVSHLIVITGKTTAPECTVFKQKRTSVKLFGFCCIFRSQYYVQIALAQNFCKGWGSYVYCVNMVRIHEFTQRVWALPLTEILCKNALNIAMWPKHATEWCSISTRDCHICTPWKRLNEYSTGLSKGLTL